ncbi:MAG: hypothetical protein H0T76_10920 [Nannocystis sp.]|nr:hypothetical protein [Nannocystis sp.]MBA3546985.1 hypothetical protein [Nannocystis sp.]
MSLRLGPLALLAALLACDGRGEVGKPVNSPSGPPDASAGPVVVGAPVAAVDPVDEAPEGTEFPLGWWRGDDVCLELFANGDFEISVQGSGPKVLIFGGARLTATGPDAFALELTVAKIWKGRYVSACRKHHETGEWSEAQEALGVTFTPGNKATLKLRRAGDGAVELCGERCATLRRETPALRGRWRRAGLDDLSQPEPPWAADDLLELKIGSSSHVWSGGEGTQRATTYGAGIAVASGDDRFVVTFTPGSFADVPAGATPTLFGAPLTLMKPRTLNVRRLAGMKLEACDGARCGLLERQFDAFDYEVK